jgi:PIN domain nuclease of toxin-antitoxin system
LGRRAAAFFKRCENRDAILYVPTAVVWECSLLARAGRIVLHRSVRSFFEDLFSNPAYQPFDASTEQTLLADEIGFNRDPFDGLIVAAARTLDLHLITRDDDIVESRKVKTLW